MFENFIFSLNVTLPVFLVIALGKFLNKVGLFSDEFAKSADKLAFRALIPVLMFRDIAGMDFKKDFDVKFVAFCAITSFVMFCGVWLFSAVCLKDKSMVGAFSQGSARGSAAVLGIALATNIYGSSGHAPLMVLAAVPVFNVMSVVILAFSSENGRKNINILKILKGIITNPIILGILCGVPFSVFDITLPAALSSAVDSVAKTATPIALLSIGASFSLASAKSRLSPALAASFVKLVVLPVVFLPVAIYLGFSGSALVSIFVMLGSPSTVTCYIMAKNMDNDHILASNIVMISTLLSAFSVTVFVFLLKYFSLI